MTAATQKTGRVTKLTHVKGAMEYRFVPKGWTTPPGFENLCWFEFDPVEHADEYAKWKADIGHARGARLKKFTGSNVEWDFTASWYHDGKIVYRVRVDHDPVERPVLVVIGGFS